MASVKRGVQSFLDRAHEAARIVSCQTEGAERQRVGGFPVGGKADQAVGVVFNLGGDFMAVEG